MDYTNLISNVAFPIAAFLLMYKMNTDILSSINETLVKLTGALTALTTKLDDHIEDCEEKNE